MLTSAWVSPNLVVCHECGRAAGSLHLCFSRSFTPPDHVAFRCWGLQVSSSELMELEVPGSAWTGAAHTSRSCHHHIASFNSVSNLPSTCYVVFDGSLLSGKLWALKKVLQRCGRWKRSLIPARGFQKEARLASTAKTRWMEGKGDGSQSPKTSKWNG